MKNLVIVESPSKSKTIEKYLGSDFKVVSSVGHIRDLSKSGKFGFGVDVDNNFEAKYTVSKEKKPVVDDLKKLVKNANKVYLATDPDREGEAISWHLADELGLDPLKTSRVVFNEITKNAVLKAFDNPRTINLDLVKSQETRRILDRIIGFRLSKLLQSKIQSKSAGRVQSVALRMICAKEEEINKFISEEYWTIDAMFKESGYEFKASIIKVDGKKPVLNNEEVTQKVYDRLNGEFEVTNVKKQNKTRSPKAPFTTSTLQQEASTRLGFGAKRTMSIAQKLYEGVTVNNEHKGLITYMRTDSTRLSNEFIAAANNHIIKEYGKEYQGFYKVKNDENAQDAHEGIRPTDITLVPELIEGSLTAEQYKLYRFIYYRALASLMKNCTNETVQLTLSHDSIDFTANGSVLVFDGFLKVYKDYDSSKDVYLPILKKSNVIKSTNIIKEQHFTEPPARFTEARLIKAMEEEGIGRPSTYSSIIDTIQIRLYVELRQASETSKTKFFFPTDQGILTDSKLQEFFSSIINIKYTANMENELDLIADNKLNNVTALTTFYNTFMPLVDIAAEKMEKRELEKTGEKCPDCGNDLVIRLGRFGKFISCSGFPECKYTAKIAKEDKEPAEPSGIMCELCGKEMLKRKSRYGNYFLGCSGFPKCRNIVAIEGEKQPFKKKTTTKKKTSTKRKTTTKKTKKSKA